MQPSGELQRKQVEHAYSFLSSVADRLATSLILIRKSLHRKKSPSLVFGIQRKFTAELMSRECKKNMSTKPSVAKLHLCAECVLCCYFSARCGCPECLLP